MGKISKVFYQEINPDVCSMNDAAKYHYHFNLLKYGNQFEKQYEEYEKHQVDLKNKLIGDAIKTKSIDGYPKMNTSIFGISSYKNKAILITELN